jgi:hypothetical protein
MENSGVSVCSSGSDLSLNIASSRWLFAKVAVHELLTALGGDVPLTTTTSSFSADPKQAYLPMPVPIVNRLIAANNLITGFGLLCSSPFSPQRNVALWKERTPVFDARGL